MSNEIRCELCFDKGGCFRCGTHIHPTAPAWTPDLERAIHERLGLLTGRTRTPDQTDLAAALARIAELEQALCTIQEKAGQCECDTCFFNGGCMAASLGEVADAALAGTKENQRWGVPGQGAAVGSRRTQRGHVRPFLHTARSTVKDLIEALTILLKYGNPEYPTHCEHDVMTICGIDPAGVSDEDKARLDTLGFHVGSGDHDGYFTSFRFGSA